MNIKESLTFFDNRLLRNKYYFLLLSGFLMAIATCYQKKNVEFLHNVHTISPEIVIFPLPLTAILFPFKADNQHNTPYKQLIEYEKV